MSSCLDTRTDIDTFLRENDDMSDHKQIEKMVEEQRITLVDGKDTEY